MFRNNLQNQFNQIDFPLCIDSPYVKGAGPCLADCFDGIILPTVSHSIEENQSNDMSVEQQSIDGNEKLIVLTDLEQGDVKSTTTNTVSTEPSQIEVMKSVQEDSRTTPAVVKSPKQLLNEYYAKLHIKSDKGNYTTIKHDKVQIVKFACAFTCPKTGELFLGGKLKDCLYSEEDGVIWYGERY